MGDSITTNRHSALEKLTKRDCANIRLIRQVRKGIARQLLVYCFLLANFSFLILALLTHITKTMSTELKTTTQELQDIAFKIESVLVSCYSHLNWRFSDGILKGFKRGVADEYIYEYHPDSNDAQVVRLVFKEKLQPDVDTVECIENKFNRIELARLAFPTIFVADLPEDWSFIIEERDVVRQPPLKNVIILHTFDKNGRIHFALRMENIAIYGENKLTKEKKSIDFRGYANGVIDLDLTIQNSSWKFFATCIWRKKSLFILALWSIKLSKKPWTKPYYFFHGKDGLLTLDVIDM